MKKIIKVIAMVFILVGCSAKSTDTVCTTKDFQGNSGTVTLIRSTEDKSLVDKIVISGDINEDESSLTMLSAMTSQISGVDFKAENKKLDITIDFNALDTKQLAELASIFDTETELTPGQIELSLKLFRGHDVMVSGLKDNDFTCKVN